MEERRATVGSRVGLHARPASVFVQAAGRQKVRVTIAKPGGEPVSARSILSVLALDVHGGEEVVLYADGDGAKTALDELAAVLEADHDEPPAAHA
jgi:phosphocarrier protein